MLDKETKDQLDQLKLDYEENVAKLLYKYAHEHARFRVGDIIEAYDLVGKVVTVEVYTYTAGYYKIIYICDRLTKKLRPYKNGEIVHIRDIEHVTKVKTKPELDCPYDFTSRCTMGRCDCKPKEL